MHFSKSLALLAVAGAAQAAISAQQVTANMDQLSTLSTQNNEVAKTIGVTNFFSTVPKMINNFQNMIRVLEDDSKSMQKRAILVARQECLNVEDVEKCFRDLEEIIEDPGELLGDKKRSFVGSPAASVARRAAAKYDEDQQLAICSAYSSFTAVHQQLIYVVIGKHGVISLTPFSPPVRQTLQSLQQSLLKYAETFIKTVPACATDATKNEKSLDALLDKAVAEYSS